MPITKDKRFIIVVANADGSVDESDPDNNAVFVIPLLNNAITQLQKNGKVKVLRYGQHAGFNNNGDYQFGISETRASGQILPKHNAPTVASLGYIFRGTDAFDRLQSLDNIWSGSGFNGTFKDEEPAPYLGDDHLVDPALLEPISRLKDLIVTAQQQSRIPTEQYVISDAFDEQNEHDTLVKDVFNSVIPTSRGRGVDISIPVDSIPRLSGLALLAGFDWVNNESNLNHFHVSSRGGAADISTADLSAAVKFGADNGLIRVDVAGTAPDTVICDRYVDRSNQQRISDSRGIAAGQGLTTHASPCIH